MAQQALARRVATRACGRRERRGPDAGHAAGMDPLRTRAPFLPVAAWATVVTLACPACAASEPGAPAALRSAAVPGAGEPVVAGPPVGEWTCAAACRRWRPVLDRLDARRAVAYRAGRPGLLRRVYAPRSKVLAHDRRLLRDWMRRVASVSGVRLRVLDVSRLPSSGRSVRLRVVDRLSPATARLRDGRRVALPRDQPTEHVIVLRPTSTGWRIASSS